MPRGVRVRYVKSKIGIPAVVIVLIVMSCCGLVGAGVAGVFWMVNRAIGIDHLSEEEIQTGRPCTATVLSMVDTNNSYNRRRVYEFTLRVQPTDGAAYEAKVRDELSPLEQGRMSNGMTEFRCVIDKDDATRVEVFWLRSASG